MQLSLFAADARAPEPSDLAGVLAAHGHSTLIAQVAQVSVVVDAPWRADALRAVFTDAGLHPTCSAPGPDGRCTVATARTSVLTPLVKQWRRGAVMTVPEGWTPSEGALRTWYLASGRLVGNGAVDLGIDPGAHKDLPRRHALLEALGRAGLRATYVGPRGGGPALRLGTAGARGRLVAALGQVPEGVPVEYWPA